MTGEIGTTALADVSSSGPPRCDRRSIGASSVLHCRVQINAIYLLSAQIVQGDGHHLVLATDFDHPEELQAVTGWPIGFEVVGDTEELALWSKGVIEFIGAKGPGMQRTGNEFPAGVEVGELGVCRIVEMGRSIVHVRRQPHDVPDVIVFDEAEQVCQLKLAAERWTIAIGPGLKA